MITGANIYTKMMSITALTNLIGGQFVPSYNREADQAYPLCVYKVTDVATESYYYGGQIGLETANLNIACVGATAADAEAVANVIQTALDGDTSQWGTCNMQDCSLKEDGISDDVVTDPTTEAILYYVKEIVFELIYNN